jgi:heme/copper-type cytochrome/quinol oxidase subunit 2
MDISTEVASMMTSILVISIMFVVFGLMTWCVVKVYTNTWKDPKETHHEGLMNAIRKHQRGDKE